ncbi:MAG: GNAT family N-acetyltransferase [Leptolyngbya sp. SIO1D8]|nr:GNAT family N-acetyltransferase [Leptolyngbya sp. SIO1D8]
MVTAFMFQSHAYQSDADLAAIAQLINTCHITDELENRTSVTNLQESFTHPQFDATCDLRLWRDGEGDLVAAAGLWRRPPETEVLGRLEFEIHPQVRGQGLENDIIAWAEQRLQEIGKELALPIVLHSGCRNSLQARQSLLVRSGFSPERYFFRLQRSLYDPIPAPKLPAGWKIRSVDSQKDAEAWVELFNQSFVDHWNHQPITLEAFHYYRRFSTYDANLDLVIETQAGQLVTFCASKIDPEQNVRLGLKEGHVCLLGTRRGYRRLGLARSLLSESLQRLKAVGMDISTIGVDAQNPLGALALYESVGFQKVRSSTVFCKRLAP